MTCNIIVQAKMGSTRFPGKVMADCCGKPMIGRLMDRLEECRDVAERLIVVYPLYDESSVLGKYVKRRWTRYYSSAAMKQDLAGAFRNVMAAYPATSFCRICADSPFVDPSDVCNTILRHETADNLLTFGGYPGYGAVEVVDWKLFQKCLPRFDAEEREHVTLYFKRRCGLVVDYPDDLERIRHLFDNPMQSAQSCLNELARRL